MIRREPVIPLLIAGKPRRSSKDNSSAEQHKGRPNYTSHNNIGVLCRYTLLLHLSNASWQPVEQRVFSRNVFNPLRRCDWKILVSCKRDPDANGGISANYSSYDGLKVSKLEKKKPPTGRELL